MWSGESKRDATSFALLLVLVASAGAFIFPEKAFPFMQRAVHACLRLIAEAGNFVLKLLT